MWKTWQYCTCHIFWMSSVTPTFFLFLLWAYHELHSWEVSANSHFQNNYWWITLIKTDRPTVWPSEQTPARPTERLPDSAPDMPTTNWPNKLTFLFQTFFPIIIHTPRSVPGISWWFFKTIDQFTNWFPFPYCGSINIFPYLPKRTTFLCKMETELLANFLWFKYTCAAIATCKCRVATKETKLVYAFV